MINITDLILYIFCFVVAFFISSIYGIYVSGKKGSFLISAFNALTINLVLDLLVSIWWRYFYLDDFNFFYGIDF